jgi:hypothetical protein
MAIPAPHILGSVSLLVATRCIGCIGLRSFQNFGLPCNLCHETSRGDWDLAVNLTQDFHAIAEMRLRK